MVLLLATIPIYYTADYPGCTPPYSLSRWHRLQPLTTYKNEEMSSFIFQICFCLEKHGRRAYNMYWNHTHEEMKRY